MKMVILVAGFLFAPSLALAAGGTLQIQSVSPIGAISPGTSVSFAASASGFIDPTYTLSDSFSASGATVGAIDIVGYFTWTPGIYDAGRHTITVAVNDKFSHSATSTVSILVTGSAVVLTSPSPGPVVATNRPVTFTATAPGFVSPSYSVYDSFFGSSLNNSNINSSGTFSWTPRSDDLGTHTLTVMASDAYGHNGQTSQKITVINPTVSVQSLKPGSAASVGSRVSFFASAPSLALATTTYGVSDLFTGTSTVAASNIATSGLFAWTPATSDLGLHTLTVTASDAYGNAASTTMMILITSAAATTPAPAAAPQGVSTPAASGPVATNTTSKYLFTKNLALGSQGTAVVELQKRLTTLGFFSGTATGYFGPLTTASVKKFQSARGIDRVGNVGPATRAALNK